ncbi:MAG TPA: hypothetical protein VEH31_09295 [Streptosporangiaceae bacterium]|nr:hypothetical protein [Streptosporangiaceae bacterium]
MKIDGSVALVTGADRGLGQVFARDLVTRGAARVYAAARDPAAVTEPGVTPIGLDITDPDRVAQVGRRPALECSPRAAASPRVQCGRGRLLVALPAVPLEPL